MKSRKAPLLPTIIVMAMISGVAIATVIVTRQVSHTGVVVLRRDFKIYVDFACTTELTGIDWPSMYHNNKLNVSAYVKNLGEDVIYISWMAQNLPEGITLKMFWSGYEPADEAPDNTFVLWQGFRETLLKNKIRQIRFEITIGGIVPEGAFSFNTLFDGHDVETGG